MSWIELGLLFAVAAAFALCKFGFSDKKHWKKKGIDEYDNWVPFLGTYYRPALQFDSILSFFNNIYNRYKGERFIGMYVMRIPFLMVRDPDLLKQIMIKDSEYFLNRYDWSTDSDPLMRRNLSSLKGEQWRNLRMVMTSVFTASKMKDMFRFMEQCAKQSAENMEAKLQKQMAAEGSGSANVLETELKDYFSRYGTDVIASTAFGVEVDSFKNPENEFFTTGKIIKNGFDGRNFLRILMMFMFPGISKKLKLTFFGQRLNDFFNSVVSNTIREREKHNIVRRDMIHVLMEARKEKEIQENGNLVKGKLPELTDADIAAQAMLFYFGGFETMATLLGFISYELAVNPDVQQKLYEEIMEVSELNGGVTYEGIMHQMPYLKMVVNETLRKWPPVVVSDRVAIKRYTIPKTDTSPEVTLEPGDKVMIPISALHYDPEYYPEPEKFDPERFRDEKNTIVNFAFLPFGEGLRSCIGMRYALMEAKTCLVHLLKVFEIVPTKQTDIPLKLQKGGAFLIRPEKGFILGLKLRK